MAATTGALLAGWLPAERADELPQLRFGERRQEQRGFGEGECDIRRHMIMISFPAAWSLRSCLARIVDRRVVRHCRVLGVGDADAQVAD